MILVELPYPPSVNNYWRHTSKGHYITAKGKSFRRDVCLLLSKYRGRLTTGRLDITVSVYPPDRRKRDLDNITKALFDAIEHSGVIADDEQFDRVQLWRNSVVKGGKVIVSIEPIERRAA